MTTNSSETYPFSEIPTAAKGGSKLVLVLAVVVVLLGGAAALVLSSGSGEGGASTAGTPAEGEATGNEPEVISKGKKDKEED